MQQYFHFGNLPEWKFLKWLFFETYNAPYLFSHKIWMTENSYISTLLQCWFATLFSWQKGLRHSFFWNLSRHQNWRGGIFFRTENWAAEPRQRESSFFFLERGWRFHATGSGGIIMIDKSHISQSELNFSLVVTK